MIHIFYTKSRAKIYFWLQKSCIFAENINKEKRIRKLVIQVDRQQAIGMMIEEPILPQLPDFEEYILQGEPDQRQRAENWQIAIGLQAVDGLHTSEYLQQTARQHIEGEITIKEVQELVKTYYVSKSVRTADDNKTEEADCVASNITALLGETTFAMTYAGLTAIHRRIFNGVFKFAGQIRDVNITKKEWVLDGDTVRYVSAHDIKPAIEYDLEQERNFNYSRLPMSEIVRHITKFVAGIWQIHPFREGNTRTTAVFTIKYLQNIGFEVNNDLFFQNSWYFRNALVRANYQNVQKNVDYSPQYLELFFRNLLMGEHNELRNRYLHIRWNQPTSTPTTTPTSTPTSSLKNKGNKFYTDNENIRRVVNALGTEQLSIKELLVAVNLKDRKNFIEYSLNPAMKEGFVQMLYPENPKHPRQKYLLTVKGIGLYHETQ